jgi:hypothetical protein
LTLQETFAFRAPDLSNGIVAKIIIKGGEVITCYPLAGAGVVSANALLEAIP